MLIEYLQGTNIREDEDEDDEEDEEDEEEKLITALNAQPMCA